MIIELEDEKLIIETLGVSIKIEKEGNISVNITLIDKGSTVPFQTFIIPASPETNMKRVLKTPLEDLDLSVRAFQQLKDAKINNLIELVQHKEEDLLNYKKFGQKSVSEIEEVLIKRGLRFGMELSDILKIV
jgi:DNA-directed RNA polymerase alpha subunit